MKVNRLLLRNVSVVGAAWGEWVARDPSCRCGWASELERLIEAGAIRPVIGDVLPLERGADAFRLLADRKAVGKVILQSVLTRPMAAGIAGGSGAGQPGDARPDPSRVFEIPCHEILSTPWSASRSSTPRSTSTAASSGLREVRRIENEKGRFTLIFLAAPDDAAWSTSAAHRCSSSPTTGTRRSYRGGRNFGHLAYEVDDIYATCQRLQDGGVTINRPPRDGRMAFVRSPDGISIELLQAGDALPPSEPWASMPNTGEW